VEKEKTGVCLVTFKNHLWLFFCGSIVLTSFGQDAFGQDRQRVVTTSSVRPVAQPSTAEAPRPVARVETTSSNSLVSAVSFRSAYDVSTSSLLIKGIQSRWGTPYRRGSTGPDRFDCSGFVWSVFKDAGFEFTRSSARTFWEEFEPVDGPERFTFGTLVFFNKLGHVGIVADENGFYHASTSKGVIYSPFKGYWENRIDGFRKIPEGVQFTFEYGEN